MRHPYHIMKHLRFTCMACLLYGVIPHRKHERTQASGCCLGTCLLCALCSLTKEPTSDNVLAHGLGIALRGHSLDQASKEIRNLWLTHLKCDLCRQFKFVNS